MNRKTFFFVWYIILAVGPPTVKPSFEEEILNKNNTTNFPNFFFHLCVNDNALLQIWVEI